MGYEDYDHTNYQANDERNALNHCKLCVELVRDIEHYDETTYQSKESCVPEKPDSSVNQMTRYHKRNRVVVSEENDLTEVKIEQTNH